MGNTSSKQTRTSFEPQAPTEVTPKLLNAVSDITETDYVLEQNSKSHMQREAGRYLENAQKAASKHIDEAYAKISSKKLKESDLSAKDLLVRVEKLQHELDSRPKRGTFDSKVLGARDDLVECLTNNKDKPLNCYDQFTEFKKIVA